MFESITEAIQFYLSMWGPSITAIAGVVGAIFAVLHKVDKFIKEATGKDQIAQAAQREAALEAKMNEVIEANKNLVEQNRILTDEIAKVEGYSETVKKEETWQAERGE